MFLLTSVVKTQLRRCRALCHVVFCCIYLNGLTINSDALSVGLNIFWLFSGWVSVLKRTIKVGVDSLFKANLTFLRSIERNRLECSCFKLG